jgi:2-iminobutanoate/2-iminopropanoate deaminase
MVFLALCILNYCLSLIWAVINFYVGKTVEVNFMSKGKIAFGQGKFLSKAVVFGDLVFVSGIGPHDPETGRVVEGGIREQTRRVMESMKAILEEAGSSLENVLKCTVFLADMNDYNEMNEVYSSYFKIPPARTCVQVSKLPRPGENVLIEIDAVAYKPS